MGTRALDEIENEFAHLSPQAQLNLLERLLHRVRVGLAGRPEDWEPGLSAMADDAEVQRELGRINAEFRIAEADGLEKA